jgi:hypothetical protein
VISCLPLDIKKNVTCVGEMESADADLIVYEEIPCTPEEIIEEIFQEMRKPLPTQELCCENDRYDDDDTVSDEHVMPPPNHEDAL